MGDLPQSFSPLCTYVSAGTHGRVCVDASLPGYLRTIRGLDMGGEGGNAIDEGPSEKISPARRDRRGFGVFDIGSSCRFVDHPPCDFLGFVLAMLESR